MNKPKFRRRYSRFSYEDPSRKERRILGAIHRQMFGGPRPVPDEPNKTASSPSAETGERKPDQEECPNQTTKQQEE
jgi:hypothetical protein